MIEIEIEIGVEIEVEIEVEIVGVELVEIGVPDTTLSVVIMMRLHEQDSQTN